MAQFDQLQEDQPKGVQQASFDQLEDDNSKYETTGQQIKTGLEGAAEGVVGPLATATETKLLGVKPEDIAGRRKANPVIHGIGQAAGLAGGMAIPGLGEYSLGSKIAEAGSAAAGLAEAGSVASGAVKAASEMALIQASDETSKWLEHDPNQTMQSAIANIGLSAALGGAGGAAFTKAGSVIKSLGESPEAFAQGFRLNLDPLKANEPLFQGMASEGSNKAVAKSSQLGKDIAQAIIDNGPIAVSEGAGASLGAALGHMSGIPGGGWAGALIGERALSPMIKSIIPAIGKKLASMDVSGAGFVSAVNAMEQAIRGKQLVEKAASGVFGNAFDLSLPSKQDRANLDEKVRTLQNNPQQSIEVMNGHLDHYVPDHGASLGQTIGQSIQYLNGIRPNDQKQSPLDGKPIPDPIAEAKYNRALDIAEQPLLLMNNIKKGTLTSTDIAHLANMYPALYDQMKSSLMNSMAGHLTKNESVPYKTRLGLSLFMGQPLDSSMKPMSILASQPAPQQVPNGAPGVKNTKHSTQNLSKIANLDATPSQAKAMRAQKG